MLGTSRQSRWRWVWEGTASPLPVDPSPDPQPSPILCAPLTQPPLWQPETSASVGREAGAQLVGAVTWGNARCLASSILGRREGGGLGPRHVKRDLCLHARIIQLSAPDWNPASTLLPSCSPLGLNGSIFSSSRQMRLHCKCFRTPARALQNGAA